MAGWADAASAATANSVKSKEFLEKNLVMRDLSCGDLGAVPGTARSSFPLGTLSFTQTDRRWFQLRAVISLTKNTGPRLTRGRISQDPENIMSTQNIAVHLPDGSIREVPAGTTPLDIANSISPRLAAASVVARLTPVTTETQREGGDRGRVGGCDVCGGGCFGAAAGGSVYAAECGHEA